MAVVVAPTNHLYVLVKSGSGSEWANADVEEVAWSATRFLRLPQKMSPPADPDATPVSTTVAAAPL